MAPLLTAAFSNKERFASILSFTTMAYRIFLPCEVSSSAPVIESRALGVFVCSRVSTSTLLMPVSSKKAIILSKVFLASSNANSPVDFTWMYSTEIPVIQMSIQVRDQHWMFTITYYLIGNTIKYQRWNQ